jgi:sugar phosphate isomerase/epimerase
MSSPNGSARYAFSTPTQGDVEQRQLFDGFRPYGFQGLQLKSGQYDRYIGRPEQFLDEWEGDEGSRSGLICSGDLDENGVEALRAVINFASDIGGERVIFCHGRPRETVTNDDIRGFAVQLSQLGLYAAERSVKLSLHNHYNSPVMHKDDFDVFFGAALPGAVGLTLDTAHLVWSGFADIAGVMRDYAVFLDNVHLKDFAQGRFRTLGHGDIDFGEVFAALRYIGYGGWLCADEESETPVLASMQASFEIIDRGWRDAP